MRTEINTSRSFSLVSLVNLDFSGAVDLANVVVIVASHGLSVLGFLLCESGRSFFRETDFGLLRCTFSEVHFTPGSYTEFEYQSEQN